MPSNNTLMIHAIRDATIVNFADASILDAQQVQRVGQELFDLIDKQAHRKIVLDFGRVRFLSSSALGILITLRKKADAIKARVVFCNLRNDLRKVFKITNLEKMFEFYGSEDEAMAVFGVTTTG